MNPDEKCLVEFCNKERKLRGLCLNHYTNVRALIRAQRIDEAELIAKGKILAKNVGNKKRNSGELFKWLTN